MATTKPRINVPFAPAAYKELVSLAKERGCSLSEQVRSMVLEMLELIEDRELASAATSRRRTLRKKTALSHEEMWGRKAKRRR
jgi:hypothetical protein